MIDGHLARLLMAGLLCSTPLLQGCSRSSALAAPGEADAAMAEYAGGNDMVDGEMLTDAGASSEQFEAQLPPGAAIGAVESPVLDDAKRADESATHDGGPKSSGDEGGDESSTRSEEPHPGRHIVYSAKAHIVVLSRDEGRKQAEELALHNGGWVESSRGDHMVLRIPARGLRPLLWQLDSIGQVVSRDFWSEDVTGEYVDLQTRITVLEKTRDQLLELLQRAENVKDALAVRERLDELTLQLERARGRMRKLSQLLAYSRLELQLSLATNNSHQRRNDTDPFPWVDHLGVESTAWR